MQTDDTQTTTDARVQRAYLAALGHYATEHGDTGACACARRLAGAASRSRSAPWLRATDRALSA